jgi:non-canonical purine NTP pyrophosphatase (RdgB/HAM1 family)
LDSILIATTNAGKLREIRHVLQDVPLQWLTLADRPDVAEPEETGTTFAENARLKATYYAAACGMPTVAEDSGLVIDALGGRPGVLSARYPGATYPDKFRRLYRELAAHPRPWSARFVCSLMFVTPQGSDSPRGPWALGPGPWASLERFTCEATVEGEIADAPRGTFGFGYDPIFFYAPYGCTLGEVDGERKLAVAHRGKAFRQFREWLTRA